MLYPEVFVTVGANNNSMEIMGDHASLELVRFAYRRTAWLDTFLRPFSSMQPEVERRLTSTFTT